MAVVTGTGKYVNRSRTVADVGPCEACLVCSFLRNLGGTLGLAVASTIMYKVLWCKARLHVKTAN